MKQLVDNALEKISLEIPILPEFECIQ